MSGRRLDVTPTHAVSSMLATLTGAVAASGLGIGGTILGAAFMSLASTVGTAVYKHYLSRSNARLRAAAESLAPHADGSAVATAVIRRHLTADAAPPARGKHAAPARADEAVSAGQTTASAKWAAGSADAHPNGATPPGPAEGELPTRGADPVIPAQASPAPVSPAPTSAEPTALPVTPDGHESGPAARRRRVSRRTWLMAAASALGVFVIAMGAITAFEAIAGKPLDAVVWHRPNTGTTFGNIVHHHPAHPGQTARPSTSPHPSGSATAHTSTSPGASSTPTSPATSPSDTASPTTSPTAGATSPAAGVSQTPAASSP